MNFVWLVITLVFLKHKSEYKQYYTFHLEDRFMREKEMSLLFKPVCVGIVPLQLKAPG